MIYFTRHGQTDYNLKNKWMGTLDLPLNEHGKQQAYCLTQSLQRLHIKKVYSSPLSRAEETAFIISKQLGHIPIRIAHELRERDYGEFEGLLKTKENRKLIEKAFSVEAIPKVVDRVSTILLEIENNHEQSLIVSHSAIYKIIISKLNYTPSPNHNSISNCELISLNFNNGIHLD